MFKWMKYGFNQSLTIFHAKAEWFEFLVLLFSCRKFITSFLSTNFLATWFSGIQNISIEYFDFMSLFTFKLHPWEHQWIWYFFYLSIITIELHHIRERRWNFFYFSVPAIKSFQFRQWRWNFFYLSVGTIKCF